VYSGGGGLTMKKLPIGMQDFKEIITKDFVYVDKTRYLFEMFDSGKFYFISRPRRAEGAFHA
jgi:hypothetical protein